MAENRNPYAIGALFLDKNGYVETEPAEKLSLYGDQAFTVSTQFYANTLEGEISLARQEGSFDFGMKDGVPYLRLAGSAEDILKDNDVLVKQETWNTLCVTYDLEKVTLYFNGLSYFNKECKPASAPPQNLAQYHFGGNLSGYLRYIRMYTQPLSDTQAALDQLGNAVPSSDAALFLDFSLQEPKDIGKFHKQIVYKSLAVLPGQSVPINEVCRPVNIVRSLRVEETGCVKVAESKRVCQIFSQSSFTIYAKVRKAELEYRANVIFACMRDASYGVDLSLNRSFDKMNVGMFLGASGCSTPMLSLKEEGDWLDIAGVYDKPNKRLQYYVNGVAFGSAFLNVTISDFEAQVQIGNKEQGQFTYHDCIDTIAVFDAVLDITTINSFLSSPPYLFNDHLTALYSFHHRPARELVSGNELSLGENASVTYRENTQSQPGSRFAYAMEGSFAGTEYQQYAVYGLAVLLDRCLPKLFGTAPVGYGMQESSKKVTGGMAELLRQCFLSMPEVQKLADDPDTLKAEEVSRILQQLVRSYQIEAIASIFCPVEAPFLSDIVASWGSQSQQLLKTVAEQTRKEICQELLKGTKPPLWNGYTKLDRKDKVLLK